MKIVLNVALAVLAAASAAAFAPVPAGYPADYAPVVATTKEESPLIKDSSARYHEVKVHYNDMNSTEPYNRFIAEVASGQGSADIMWSSAMDLQVKLVDEGKALAYKSPEASKLPQWANHK